MVMTSRERALKAIRFEEPDRVPVVLGVSNATGIKMQPYQGLKQLLNIQAPDNYIYDWPELGSASIDEETMQVLGSDVRGVLDKFPEHIYERNQAREPHSPCLDDWGSGQKEIEPGVWFPGIHPLRDVNTIQELDDYQGWPDMDDPTRVAHVKAEAQALADLNQHAIMATPWLMFPFERAFAMQGMDKFLLNMSLYPDFAAALLRKNMELCKQLMTHFLREIGENIDIIKIGDDLGTQESLMISPKMYRNILKPIHAELIAHIKEHTNAKIFFHTDGDVFNLIEDFIEIGVDILNPIQTSAGKMSNLEGLKERYHGRVVLCGGIDTQKVLPFGTPEEVKAEVKRVINILGPGGGYMVASVHTIMHEVPPENILAMTEAVKEFGTYPL